MEAVDQERFAFSPVPTAFPSRFTLPQTWRKVMGEAESRIRQRLEDSAPIADQERLRRRAEKMAAYPTRLPEDNIDRKALAAIGLDAPGAQGRGRQQISQPSYNTNSGEEPYSADDDALRPFHPATSAYYASADTGPDAAPRASRFSSTPAPRSSNRSQPGESSARRTPPPATNFAPRGISTPSVSSAGHFVPREIRPVGVVRRIGGEVTPHEVPPPHR